MDRKDVIREIHERYQQLGRALNEIERRHWAATEALKLGRGGITLVSQALRISPNTIKRGIREITAGFVDTSAHAKTRIRKPGGGRKSRTQPSEKLARIKSETILADAKPGISIADGCNEHQHSTLTLPLNLEFPAADEVEPAGNCESPETA